MTHDYDPNTDPNVPPRDAPPRGGRAKAIPPLVWIVLGLLVLLIVVAVSQCDGSGQTTSSEAVMPATNAAA